MATLDFTKATASVDMADPNLVTFKSPGAAYSTYFNYRTPQGSSVVVRGENMTFDGDGHATGGAAYDIELDTGAYDAYRPEVKITGIAVPAATIDDGPESFWRILEGNDVIVGPSQAAALPNSEYRLFGDGIAARTGTSGGGNDIIQPGNVTAAVYGDVVTIGVQTAGAPKADHRGGADDITGAATTAYQVFVGDADIVNASGKLTGGNDTIYIQSTHENAAAAGDASFVQGVAGDIAEFIGGNDYIAGGPDFRGTLVGDALVLKEFTVARGGNDRIEGGGVREHIYGDVQYVIGGTLTGGADRLSGNGGNDTISGEAERIESGARVYGGNDTIYGGAGGDRIYGETAFVSGSIVTGGDDIVFGEAGEDVIDGQTGNDQLYGGADADRLYGGVGNDFLDGGSGADQMDGGAGNDHYVVDNAADMMFEGLGQGIDSVITYLNSHVLGDNIENVTSFATGNFSGIGNGLANVIVSGVGADGLAGRAGNDTLVSGAGDDQLHGEEGNDVMDGGLGRDRFEGGDGFDTISYASAGQGVRFSLDSSLIATGDAVGDNYLGVEALSGSAFADVLRGDALNNRLSGEAGNDLLQGQAGNDVIVGGLGGDTLFGGAGNDRFDFLSLAEAGDSIRDFANATNDNDTLRFDDAGFGGLALGTLAAKHFTANAAGVATTLDHRFVYETDTGVLRFDANGSAEGGRTIVATLAGIPTLTAADFFII